MKRLHREADMHGITVTETEGGRHTKLYVGGTMIPIPRHGEINEMTAQTILKQCEPMFGKGWWR